MVRFAIDDCSVDLNRLDAAEARCAFTTFLEFIVQVTNEGHGICYDEDLFCRNLWGGRTFWELFDPDADLKLDHDDLELAATVFGTMPKWHELPLPQPVDFDVQVGSGPVETTGSVAWVHAQRGRGLEEPACLCAPHGRTIGRNKVLVAGVDRPIWFAASIKDIEHFFRDLLGRFAESPRDFARLASHAFRDLLFVNGCFDGMRKMSRSCRDLAPDVVTHLSAFSDVGQRIFSGRWQDAAAEFGSLGVNISDENGGTKRDKKAAAERVRTFEGKEMHFWWHSKIEHHRDRIHICPDRVPAGGKVIVGIFCLHLE
jgi:hypothetical protein